MDKKTQINFNLNNFLLSTSLLLDYVQRDFNEIDLNHTKRVAYIAINLGRSLGLDVKLLADLCSYSLVHNIGLKNSNNCDVTYCLMAEESIKDFPFLNGLKDILKYQKEAFNGTGPFRLKGNDIPLLSQILFLATTLDEKFNLSNEEVKTKYKAIGFVKANEAELFSVELVDKFINLSESISFWLDLQSENEMIYFIYNSLADFTIPLKFDELLKITTVFHKLVNPSSSLIKLSDKLTDYYGFDYKDKYTFMIAACMHNIGKLAIPKKILNKTKSLSRFDYEKVKSYPYFTKRVLNNIIGFSDIANLSIKVQERLDKSGYPFLLDAKSLSFRDRVLQTIIVYHALREYKPRRKEYSHKEAIKVLIEEEVSKHRIDLSIVEDIDKLFS